MVFVSYVLSYAADVQSVSELCVGVSKEPLTNVSTQERSLQ
jgi:hypothetical protein